MAITSKNCLVSHVLTFDKGELVGGYIEDCDLFIDCYGFVLGSSETRRTAIKSEQLGSISALLELVYEDYSIAPIVEDPKAATQPIEVAPEDWGTVSGSGIAKDVIADSPVVVKVPTLPAPALEPPVVSPDPIVLPTATEASPAVLVPVKALPDVVITPYVTPVVAEVKSVTEDAKPETQPTVEPTSEPVAVVAPSEPARVVEVAAVDPQVPAVVADGLDQAQTLPSPDVANVIEAPTTIETKTTDNLNATDNELAIKAFL